MTERKRQSMSHFVNSAREEIVALWDDLMMGPADRSHFTAMHNGTVHSIHTSVTMPSGTFFPADADSIVLLFRILALQMNILRSYLRVTRKKSFTLKRSVDQKDHYFMPYGNTSRSWRTNRNLRYVIYI